MATTLKLQLHGRLRGILLALLLAVCLSPASAQESVTGTLDGDSVYATVNGVTFHFFVHGSDSLTVDNAYGYTDTLDIPGYVNVGETLYKVTKVPNGIYGNSFGKKKFKVLILPETLYDYGEQSFCHCFNLEKVVSKRAYPVSTWYALFNSDSDFLWRERSSLYIYHNAVLNVPFGSKPYYSNFAPWRFFTTIEEGLEPNVGYNAPVLSADSTSYTPDTNVFTQAVRVTLTNPNTAGDIYYYIISGNGFSRTSDVLKYEGPVELTEPSGIVAYVTDGTTRSQTLTAQFNILTNSLFVQGEKVTQDNMYDILCDKGSVAIDPKSGALVLTNANINPGGKTNEGIKAYGDNLTIMINGNSTITGGNYGIDFNYGDGRMASQNGPTLTIEGQNNGTDTLTVNGLQSEAIFAYLSNLTIRNCVVIANGATKSGTGVYFKAGGGKIDGTLTIDNATLHASGGRNAIDGVFNLNLSDNVSILSPKGARFVSFMDHKECFSNIVDATGAAALTAIIGIASPKPTEISPVVTDSNNAVDVVDTNNITESTDLNNQVVNNVYFNINTTGSEQTGYYDSTDNSLVLVQTTNNTDMATIASSENPISVAADNGYTGLILMVPEGQGIITVETQTYGTTAVAVQVGTDAPQTITSGSQEETNVSYTVAQDSYVYLYTTNNSSAAVGTRAMAAPTNGAKIFSVKVKQVLPTGIDSVEGVNGVGKNAPMYNTAGQRVGRDYKGIIIQNGRKIIRR